MQQRRQMQRLIAWSCACVQQMHRRPILDY
eukprot:COSAG01_NODE_10682_length_2105_cov_1.118087_1_plen_29_part_10